MNEYETGLDPAGGLNGAVAAVLRGERAANNMKLEDLATHSGIPERSLQRYLAAERPINIPVLYALTRALSTTAAAVVAAGEVRMGRIPVGVDGDAALAAAAYDVAYTNGAQPGEDEQPEVGEA